LREEPQLRVFEDGVLRKTLRPKRDEVTGSGDYIRRSFMLSTPHQMSFG
jgi:hypothetical protein